MYKSKFSLIGLFFITLSTMIVLFSCNAFSSQTGSISFSLNEQSVQKMASYAGLCNGRSTFFDTQIAESSEWVMKIALSGGFTATKEDIFNLSDVLKGSQSLPKLYFPGIPIGKTVTVALELYKKEDTAKIDGFFSGTATSTIVAGENQVNLQLTWTAPKRSALLSPKKPITLYANPGDTIQLSANFFTSKAPNEQMTWASSDTERASVDPNGLVTITASGYQEVTITATTTEELPALLKDDEGWYEGTPNPINNKIAKCTIKIAHTKHAIPAIITSVGLQSPPLNAETGFNVEGGEKPILNIETTMKDGYSISYDWRILNNGESTPELVDNQLGTTKNLTIDGYYCMDNYVYCIVTVTDPSISDANLQKAISISDPIYVKIKPQIIQGS